MIPILDIAPLFGPESAARVAADRAVRDAARDLGFLQVRGVSGEVALGRDARAGLLRIFSLAPADQRRLWRHAWAPENPNVYRGYFPLSAGVIKEGIDIGPERAAPEPGGDALAEETPLPDEATLPGWRSSVRERFAGLERVGQALMHSLARGMGLSDDCFDEAFRDGNSTLRLIVYPPWPAEAERHGLPLRPFESADGVKRYDIGGEHVDSGLVTLLEQDDAGGLQAKLAGDRWVDVPPVEGSLVVNFGKLLERWTGNRIRATEHRVLGNDAPRASIPFFYEPRIDARIEPLPIPGVEPFEPFLYGDHLWDAMTRFAEFAGTRRHSRAASG
jgi:isopenicillin N synthase-like dioxygenase